MKTTYIFTLFFIILTSLSFAQVGIGTNTPAPSAQLDISSTERGFLMPRMTMAQRNLIASPATGLTIYQTDNTAGFYFFDGSNWVTLGAAGVDGKNTLIKTTTETAGSNCTSGGVKQEYGLDANSNGILDASEVNSAMTKYVCNGENVSNSILNIPSKTRYQLNQLLNTVPMFSMYFDLTNLKMVIKTGDSQTGLYKSLESNATPIAVYSSGTPPLKKYLLSFQVTDSIYLTENIYGSNIWELYVDDNNLTNGIGSLIHYSSGYQSSGIYPVNKVLVPNETYRLRLSQHLTNQSDLFVSSSSFTSTGNFFTNLQFHLLNNTTQIYENTSQFPKSLFLSGTVFSGFGWTSF
jgi:hypothetical protein